MPLRFWPFELKLYDSCWDPTGVFLPRMRQECQVQKAVMGVLGSGTEITVSMLPQTCQSAVSMTIPGTGEVSVLPRVWTSKPGEIPARG